LKVDLLEQSKQGKRYVGSFCLLTLQCCGWNLGVRHARQVL
jgi:hypothetical protein